MKELTRQKLTYASMKCCNAQILWLRERFPNFCPECGAPSLFYIHQYTERVGKRVSNWDILLEKEVLVIEIGNIEDRETPAFFKDAP